jgi:serine/threonine protein kinase
MVRYLHSNGIAHRNLRPEMIFFETDANLYDLKILDLLTFGEVSKVSGKPTLIQD